MSEAPEGAQDGAGTDPVHELALLMSSCADSARAFASAARLVACGLGTDGCIVYRVEPDGALTVVAHHPVHDAGAAARLRLPSGFGVTGRVAVDGVPAVLVDDSPRNEAHRALLGLTPGQRVSRLVVPARSGPGEVTGVLAVHTYGTRRFAPGDVAAARRWADLLALRIRLDRSAAALAAAERNWEGLVAATAAAQEAERRRVAGELHDGVTQVIASLTFRLSAASSAFAAGDPADAAEQVRAARELADLAFAETRNAITGLHSPVLDDLGLPAALASLGRHVPGLDVDVDADECVLPDGVATTLYRIAQEALQNVVKHAAATNVRITLSPRRSGVVLRIADDGAGFDPTSAQLAGTDRAGGDAHFGLAGMHERARLLGGRLTIASRPGEGTTIEVVVPAAG